MKGYRTGESLTILTVASNISQNIGTGKVTPFFCHHFKGTDIEVPKREDGEYPIPTDPKKAADLVGVCAGWRAMVDRIRKVREADLAEWEEAAKQERGGRNGA